MVMERGSTVAANRAAGIELRASTGSRQTLTHVAWAKNASANFGAESRMVAKRESEPEDEIRVYRWVPTAGGLEGGKISGHEHEMQVARIA